MSDQLERPKVGVGIHIVKDGKYLLMFKKSKHGTDTWSAPGGHLEHGESWEECGRREALEETGLAIGNIRFGGVTNDIYESGRHYVTVHLVGDWQSGEPENREPEKCEKMAWFGPDELPQPLFLSTRNFLEKRYNLPNFK